MDNVLCIPGNKTGVSLLLRGVIQFALSSVNKAGLPLLCMLLVYSGPCVLASVFISTVKTYRNPNSKHLQECEVIVI